MKYETRIEMVREEDEHPDGYVGPAILLTLFYGQTNHEREERLVPARGLFGDVHKDLERIASRLFLEGQRFEALAYVDSARPRLKRLLSASDKDQREAGPDE